jgi:cellulose synthase/poly-beta-1,6-N-acetylglucosamine synthase-like glycosyltransferase
MHAWIEGNLNFLYFVYVGILLILNVWGFYHIPILIAGIKNQRDAPKHTSRKEKRSLLNKSLPSVSAIIPVKNEETVISRLLEALLRLDYPLEKKEIIIVEDGSTDRTGEICEQYARRYCDQIKVIRRSMSNGKPSALNFALKQVQGDIVAVFDADFVPEPNIFMKMAKYFEDTSIAVVQGRICSINEDENILTKFVSYELAVWFETLMRGKDALNLFVSIEGSNYFIRRRVLEEVGGWDSESLCEDSELAARLVEKSFSCRYAPDVLSWQEIPAKLTWLFGQRTRWLRGAMEISLKHGKLIKKLNRTCVDAEVTFAGSFMLALCFVGYFLGFLTILIPSQPGPVLMMTTQVMTFLSAFHLSVAAIALIYATKLWKTRKMLWLPLIYIYWIIEAFIAAYALICFLLKRPRKWTKTERKGTIASSAFSACLLLHACPQIHECM